MVRAAFQWPARCDDRRLWHPADNESRRAPGAGRAPSDSVSDDKGRAPACGSGQGRCGGGRTNCWFARLRSSSVPAHFASGSGAGLARWTSSTSKESAWPVSCARAARERGLYGAGGGLGGGGNRRLNGGAPGQAGAARRRAAGRGWLPGVRAYQGAALRHSGCDDHVHLPVCVGSPPGAGFREDEYLLEPLPGHRLVDTVDRLLMDRGCCGVRVHYNRRSRDRFSRSIQRRAGC